ncbi:MAG: glucose-6-phosphate isomerase [Desulfobacter sp.]|nr:MAG: glucose-6-phosphate isomerase [Desulfobacter sp.]
MDHPGLLLSGHPGMDKHNRQLTEKAAAFSKQNLHLRKLVKQPGRFKQFSLSMDNSGATKGLFFDFSRQRLDTETLDRLREAAATANALARFSAMASGERVNTTENRAALHTAARGSGTGDLCLGEMDVRREIEQVQSRIRNFCRDIRSGALKGTTGRPFTHAVVVGIGGSYLGCEFVYRAMARQDETGEHPIELHFLPNVDIDNFASVIREINPETTLWIIISKSYTTTETMANLNQALSFLHTRGLSPRDHLVTVTAKGSPGDDPSNPVLASFHMFDFIGGRYSVSSAVGGVPLGLAFGWDAFSRFLDGCRAMDEHTLTAPPESNIPLTAALVSIWNTLFLNYPAQGIIPYASRLSKLAPHVQQLYMESMGKSVSSQGLHLTRPAGTIIFGEPGTNAQHSFFQLAHQGPAFPIDFIGVVRPGFKGEQALSKGVTNHQELWANLLAQAKALATGQDHKNPARQFEGNRPSSIISLDDLSPESIGMLLSFYEARTVLEGFILGINPFDQFGVELGKTMAGDLRQKMAAANENKDYRFKGIDDGERFYLDRLFASE